MKSVKCPSCGANIYLDKSKDVNICEFCSTPFVSEEEISYSRDNSNNSQTIINNYYTISGPTNTIHNSNFEDYKSRPRVKLWLVILLLYFGFFPVIIYIYIVKKKQREWDKQYRRIR